MSTVASRNTNRLTSSPGDPLLPASPTFVDSLSWGVQQKQNLLLPGKVGLGVLHIRMPHRASKLTLREGQEGCISAKLHLDQAAPPKPFWVPLRGPALCQAGKPSQCICKGGLYARNIACTDWVIKQISAGCLWMNSGCWHAKDGRQQLKKRLLASEGGSSHKEDAVLAVEAKGN